MTAAGHRPDREPLDVAVDVGVDPLLTSYMEQVGKVDLLTPEEEVDLSKRARAGTAAQALLDRRSGQLAQEERLERLVRLGHAAHDRMVRANLRLVIAIAGRYRGRGLDLPDLVQEGNLGLLRGVERFDPAKGFRFSTYATWWIRQAIVRGLADRSRTMRLPSHVHETLSRARAREVQLLHRLGREPTPDEVAEALGIAPEKLDRLRRAAQVPLSLDSPVDSDGDATVGSLMPDERAPNPETRAAEVMRRETIRQVLATLDDRERGVLELRFGLVDGRARTLDEVGARIGVTRERARQIELKTLAKLRHAEEATRLRGLAEDLSA